jgi:hypothetical protein
MRPSGHWLCILLLINGSGSGDNKENQALFVRYDSPFAMWSCCQCYLYIGPSHTHGLILLAETSVVVFATLADERGATASPLRSRPAALICKFSQSVILTG